MDDLNPQLNKADINRNIKILTTITCLPYTYRNFLLENNFDLS